MRLLFDHYVTTSIVPGLRNQLDSGPPLTTSPRTRSPLQPSSPLLHESDRQGAEHVVAERVAAAARTSREICWVAYGSVHANDNASTQLSQQKRDQGDVREISGGVGQADSGALRRDATVPESRYMEAIELDLISAAERAMEQHAAACQAMERFATTCSAGILGPKPVAASAIGTNPSNYINRLD